MNEKTSDSPYSKKHKAAVSFCCYFCNLQTESFYFFRLHLAIHPELENAAKSVDWETDFYCGYCFFKGLSKSDLNVHAASHMCEQRYRCATCGYTNFEKGKVLSHCRHTNEKENVFDMMSRVFVNDETKIIDLDPRVRIGPLRRLPKKKHKYKRLAFVTDSESSSDEADVSELFRVFQTECHELEAKETSDDKQSKTKDCSSAGTSTEIRDDGKKLQETNSEIPLGETLPETEKYKTSATFRADDYNEDEDALKLTQAQSLETETPEFNEQLVSNASADGKQKCTSNEDKQIIEKKLENDVPDQTDSEEPLVSHEQMPSELKEVSDKEMDKNSETETQSVEMESQLKAHQDDQLEVLQTENNITEEEKTESNIDEQKCKILSNLQEGASGPGSCLSSEENKTKDHEDLHKNENLGTFDSEVSNLGVYFINIR